MINPCFGEPAWPPIHLQFRPLFKWIGACCQSGEAFGKEPTHTQFLFLFLISRENHPSPPGVWNQWWWQILWECLHALNGAARLHTESRVGWAWARGGTQCGNVGLCSSTGHRPLAWGFPAAAALIRAPQWEQSHSPVSGWGGQSWQSSVQSGFLGSSQWFTRQGFDADGTKINLGINIPITIKQPQKLRQLNSCDCELWDLLEFPKHGLFLYF